MSYLQWLPHNNNLLSESSQVYRSPVTQGIDFFLEKFYFSVCNKSIAWFSKIILSMMSWIAPVMIAGMFDHDSLIRWSVTRSCGKLYVLIFSDLSPVPICVHLKSFSVAIFLSSSI